MSTAIHATALTLTCPVHEAEFDPYDRKYLVVGGGGGTGGSGVENLLNVLDVSDHSTVTTAAEIKLAKDEEAPWSLGNVATPTGLITFAGVNSSISDRAAGKNDHFRSYIVEYPHKKPLLAGPAVETVEGEQDVPGKITFAGKHSLFNTSWGTEKYAYQRLLRLSPVRDQETTTKRIGAVATGDARKENQIVIFDATTFIPDKSSVLKRITLPGNAEAQDLDVIEVEKSVFTLTYCTENESHMYSLTCDFSTKSSRSTFDGRDEPSLLYSVIQSETSEQLLKPSLRCTRWISPHHILLLQSLPKNKGAEFLVLRVQPSTSTAFVAHRRRLPRSVLGAVSKGLTVCHLDRDPHGERQIVVAMAGVDLSIHIYTMTHHAPWKDMAGKISNLTPYRVLPKVHEIGISKITFSNFFPPRQPVHSNLSVASTTQHIQLASVSPSGKVAVHWFPLTSIPVSPHDTSMVSEKSRPPGQPSVRWVLSSSTTERFSSFFGMAIIAITVLTTAFFLQAYLNPQSNSWLGTAARLRGNLPQSPSTVSRYLRSMADGAGKAAGSLADEITGQYAAATSNIEQAALSHSVQQRLSGILHTAEQAAESAMSKAEEVVKHSYAEVKDTVDGKIDQAWQLIEEAGTALPVIARVRGHQLRDLLATQRPHPPGVSINDEATTPDKRRSIGTPVHIELTHDGEAGYTGELSASQHHDEEALRGKGARRFDELHAEEREAWKELLKMAGHWTEEEGETILKSIFFGGWGQAVGDVVGRAMAA